MVVRTKLALVVAALAMAGALGCSLTQLPAGLARTSATRTAPGKGNTPQGGVEVALSAIRWPQGSAVARVNGTDIPTDVWRQEVTRQLRVITTQYPIDWHQKANLDRLPSLLERELDRMIDMELLRQLAAREKLTLSDAEVKEASEKARQDILAAGKHKDLQAFLKANELTTEQFDRMVREQLLLDRMVQAHGGPAEVEQVHARHILVGEEEKAREVQEKLAAGESFEDLAKQYSVDGTREQGGDLGWIPRGTMASQFDEVAFALQPGETSDVVKSDFGYHIIRVEERGVRPLEEPMLGDYRQRVFVAWLEGQKRAAKIERLYTPGA